MACGLVVFGGWLLRGGPDRQAEKHAGTVKFRRLFEPGTKAGISVMFNPLRKLLRIDNRFGCDGTGQVSNSAKMCFRTNIFDQKSKIML
ncbi:hypothetical protein FBZ96_11637 [Bradyrhizobium stylosanthis]|uniref:Uncharacterized protein n=1 Tax=Bradyrhizobium stylosanthis TaxID=1803665 RepID=A0A560CZI2_9BRAD|nr:hypothetical protein FBZ96_11637 [Bradyrhizobium stylosanthis]